MKISEMLVTFLGRGVAGDVTKPTCTITSASSGAVAGTFTVTITFSEAVIGFDNSKITVVNGSAAAVGGTGPYTSVITPTATGAVTVTVAAGVVADAAGNTNEVSNTFSIVYVVAGLWFQAGNGTYQDSARTTPATQTNDPLGSWSDLSGNARHVSAATTARPTLQLAQLNDKPSHLYDASNDSMSKSPFAGLISGASATMVIVCNRVGTAAGLHFTRGNVIGLGITSLNRFKVLLGNGTTIVAYNSDTNVVATDGTYAIFIAIANGTDTKVYMYKNGGVPINGAGSTITTTLADTSSAMNMGDAGFNQNTCEFMLFDGVLSAAQLNALGVYLNGRYGIAWTNF